MAMRSQVWNWDLARGKGVSQTGSIKTIVPLASLTSSVNQVNITNPGTGYSTGITTTTITTGSGNGSLTLNITSVGGSGNIITAEVVNPGSAYALSDTGNIVGGDGNATYIIPSPPLTPPNGGLVSFGYGFDFSTGTYVVAGGNSDATLNVSSVTATGEVSGTPSIVLGGSGFSVNDIVYIQPGPPYNLTAVYTVTEINTIFTSQDTNAIKLGESFSVFIEKGNRLKNKPMTKESQFIVVENFGCTPTSFFPGTVQGGAWDLDNYRASKIRNSLGGPRAYMQFYVNTTGYFKDPDGVARDGIPGNVAPYPLTEQFNACNDRVQTPVYILPTQTWDLRLTCYNDNQSATGQETHIQSTELGNLQAFFKYTLYDGVDCLIALKLLEQNITITPENVDTFKKNLFGQNVQLEASESNKQ
ncbi:MAG: hypothetical protein K0U52_04135 [Gammaproteobacteria bacterium]|nr:hypothetical protein [Gammaproteobacteria bacterium]